MSNVTATFDGRVFVPHDAVNLPAGKRVSIDFVPIGDSGSAQGVHGSAILDLAGTLSKEAAAEMLNAIEAGCEQVDRHGW